MPQSNPDQSKFIRQMVRNRDGSFAWQRIVLLAVVVGLYFLVQPWLASSLGLPLPGWKDLTTSSEPVQVERKESAKPNTKTESNRSQKKTSATEFLKEIEPGVFESPAGLIYEARTRTEHRIDHIMAHAKDAPNRPIHGVFDPGDSETVFEVIDEGYSLAKSGKRTKRKREGPRTVYTIDLARPIGYVGGRDGKRDGHPTTKQLRLVLEEVKVITAFPVEM